MSNPLFDAIASMRARQPGKVLAELPGGRTVTWQEFFTGAERMAAALAGLGLRPGDRVAVQAEKSVEMLQLYVGCVMAGGVFLPLNTAYTPSEVAYFLENARPHLMICDPGRRESLAEAAAQAGTVHLLTLAADGTGGLTEDAAAQGAGFPPVARDPEDLAAILYTSGTTGRSKGAMLSHRALISNSRTLAQLWRFDARDVLIHALPIYHTHGLFVATNIVLMAGASMIFLPRFDADAVLEAMPRATAMMGVPTFYTRLLDHPGLTREAAANMRLFISGSAPLLASTHRDWTARTGHAILERYGLTECNMNTSNPYDGERRPGTVGFPLPDVELRICDPDTGRPVTRGEVGVIEVRGPNLFSGYWEMPEKTAQDMRPDGFFITGDLGMQDEDGYVIIVGRAKDLVISGGLNVYPKEVEDAIDALPGIRESAVIGVPHPDLGEGVVAIVVPEAGSDQAAGLTEDEILAGIADRLARFKQPKAVKIVDALPRNTMGKVQKALLREQYAGLFGAEGG